MFMPAFKNFSFPLGSFVFFLSISTHLFADVWVADNTAQQLKRFNNQAQLQLSVPSRPDVLDEDITVKEIVTHDRSGDFWVHADGTIFRGRGANVYVIKYDSSGNYIDHYVENDRDIIDIEVNQLDGSVHIMSAGRHRSSSVSITRHNYNCQCLLVPTC